MIGRRETSPGPRPPPHPLDVFIPNPDVRERHQTVVHAPATLVFEVAYRFDLQSVRLVRSIFRLRARLMGASSPPDWHSRGFVADALGMGWARLAEQPARFFIAGAACQPWRADVVFSPIPPDRFADFAEPDLVKIAWTLEVEPTAPAVTILATETRVVATDDQARTRFRWYWRLAGIGILAIRWLVLPAIRRQAEAAWQRDGGSAVH